jgi:hypothetical protein
MSLTLLMFRRRADPKVLAFTFEAAVYFSAQTFEATSEAVATAVVTLD